MQPERIKTMQPELVKANFFFLIIAMALCLFMTDTSYALPVQEIALDSAAPPQGFADVIIEASVAKASSDVKSGEYVFKFIVGGKRFSQTVAGKTMEGGNVAFATKLRIRVPEGKNVIKFDSYEKMRPFIVNATFVGGKVHSVQFRPIYTEVKGKTNIEYEAWMGESKLPIRYERFNIH